MSEIENPRPVAGCRRGLARKSWAYVLMFGFMGAALSTAVIFDLRKARMTKAGMREVSENVEPRPLFEVPNRERAINQVWTADFLRGPAPPRQEPQWRENKYQRDENENVNCLGAHNNAPYSGPEIIKSNGFFTHRQISFPFYPITSPSRPSRGSSFSPSAPVARR